MEISRLALPLLVLAIALPIAAIMAQPEIRVQSNLSETQYANKTIQAAEAYIEKINESTYLVFVPNLTQAYAYLSKAKKVLNASPYEAMVYADEAKKSAAAAYAQLNAYRVPSALAMLAFTIVIAAILARIMRKTNEKESRQWLKNRQRKRENKNKK
ncbi:MAG: hypothetical protein ACP5MC_00165 [Candidatus Micrarchaeia archaeon]